MNFPIILISNTNNNPLSHSSLTKELDGIFIAFQNSKINSPFFFEDIDWFILIHSNKSFLDLITEIFENRKFSEIAVRNFLNNLNWGFILIYNKNLRQFKLYNDYTGIYPLYTLKSIDGFHISNNYSHLLKLASKLSLNNFGILDFLLFNYTLNNKTFVKEIQQIVGGSKLSIVKKGVTTIKEFNFAEEIKKKSLYNIDYKQLNTLLKNHISKNLINDIPTYLPLTGGFDSKVILSLLLKDENKFSTYTFGPPFSKDVTIAQAIAKQFGLPHFSFNFNDSFINKFTEAIEKFVIKSPNNPILPTLIYYELVNQKIPTSNIVTGKMGGEIITGPVIISEVVTSRFAELLLCSKNLKEFKHRLINSVNDLFFLNKEYLDSILDDYLNSNSNYLFNTKDPFKTNLTNFLANETYAKFFGVIFKNLAGKYNIINPFMDFEFLSQLLNSKFRYSKNKAFTKSPIAHFRSRRLYAQLVNEAFPQLLKSELDRGYQLNDILHLQNVPRVLIQYFIRHSKIKPMQKEPSKISELSLLTKIATIKLKESNVLDFDLINKSKVLKLIDFAEKGQLDPFLQRRLVLLLGLDFFYNLNSTKFNS